MKKFLSVFIALSMVMSLFAGVIAPRASAAQTTGVGSIVAAGDGDVGLTVSAWNTYYNATDGYIYASATGTVAVGDIRLSPVGTYAQGSVVAAGDSDVGVSLVAESVATPEWPAAVAGKVYFATAASPVAAGDYRLTPIAPYAAYTKVAAGDLDVGAVLPAGNTIATVYVVPATDPMNLSGKPQVYFSPTAALTAVAAGMIRLTAGSFANSFVTTNPATSITSTSATLNGTVGEVAASEVKFVLSGGDVGDTVASYAAGSSFTYAATGLTPNTTYTFVANAKIGSAWYAGSAVTFTTSNVVPNAVTGLAASQTAAGQVTVTWTQATVTPNGTAVTQNVVKVDGSAQPPIAAATSAVINGLTAGSHTFDVAAINAAGTGPYTGSPITVSVTTVPGAPVLAGLAGNTINTLTITPPATNGGSAILNYNIYRGGSLLVTLPATTLSYIDAGLTNGTSYSYTVKAVNALGEGTASNTVTLVPNTPPALPTATTLSGVAGNAQVTLNWIAVTANPTVDYYRVTYNPGAHTITTTSPVTNLTIGALTNGTAYTFTVAAHSSLGYGPESNAVTLTPAAPVAGLAGLRTPALDTLLPTYYMGEQITGSIVGAGITGVNLLYGNGTFATMATVVGTYFSVSTTWTNGIKEGTYILRPVGSGTYADVPVYIKYAMSPVTITVNGVAATGMKINDKNVIIQGTLSYGTTWSNPAGVLVYLVVGTTTYGPVTTDFGGHFAVTLPKVLVYGTYKLVVSDGYLPDYAGSGAVVAGTGVYASWIVTPGALTVNPAVDPTLLYADNTTQYAYVYVEGDLGPVTGLTAGAFTYTAPTGVTWTFDHEVGVGIYALRLTGTTTAGMTKFTVTTASTVGTIIFNVLTPSNTWNPRVDNLTVTDADADGTLSLRDTIAFKVWYKTGADLGITNGMYYHDGKSTVSGPVGDKYYKYYGTPVATNRYESFSRTIVSGGQIGINMQVLLWDTNDPMKAKTQALSQAFKVNPTVTGDLIAIDTDSINVGETKDVTVTVKMPSEEPRNNGVVVLVGHPTDATVTDMFTIPSGSHMRTENYPSLSGNMVTLDGKFDNTNFQDGKYLFGGITFNHAGTIDVLVYGQDGVTLTGYAPEYITVNPKVHALTIDTPKMVAGQIYPVVNVTGGIKNLTFDTTSACTGTPFSYQDNGDGTYVFNFPSPVKYAYNYTDYSYTILLQANDPLSADDMYLGTITLVKPVIAITSVHSDLLITKGFEETVTFTVTDPLTNAVMVPQKSDLGVQYTTWSVTGSKNLPVSFLDPITGTYGSWYGVNDAGKPLSITTTAAYGNKYLDTTVDKPYLSLGVSFDGSSWISYTNELLVSDPSFVISVANTDKVQLFYNVANMVTVSAQDAHKQPLVHAFVSIVGNTSGDWFSEMVSSTGYGFGGITGANGSTTFNFTPTYIGDFKALIAAVDGGIAISKQFIPAVAAPVDNTAPVITVTAGIDGSTVASDTLTLTGSVNEKVASLYVGINKVDVLPDGSFMTTVKLAAGANTISIMAWDLAGNKGTASVKVTYTAPVVKTATVIMLTIGTNIVTIDGKATSIDAAPEIVNGRAFVPIRFIAETFGATVDWLAETQGITVTLGDTTIGLQIGNATAVINGGITALEAAPYIKNGRTMVPLRVISEAFGGDVAWDAALRTITISYMP